nr:HNH endonuclease family protein [Mycobacterium haemophilum]
MKKVDKYRLATIVLAIICVLLLVLLLKCVFTHNNHAASTSTGAQPQPNRPSAQPQVSPELAKLATLPIKGRAPKTGYDRNLFGHAWTDDVTVAGGHNGCDTRNDILRRDLVEVEFKPGLNGCTVLAGVLHDPYSGVTVEFHRGRRTSSLVHIDHVVALSDAWQKGAQQWDAARRRNFANDPTNLQTTTRSMNEQKGDGDAATWLPPNKSYRCTYVSRIVDVKAAYELWVTQAEHDAIAQILTTCAA